MFDSLKQDSRPKFHGWAPGDYIGTCHQCSKQFQGDKRAITCADCAYSDIPEGYALVPVESDSKVNTLMTNEYHYKMESYPINQLPCNASYIAMDSAYKAMLNAAKGE